MPRIVNLQKCDLSLGQKSLRDFVNSHFTIDEIASRSNKAILENILRDEKKLPKHKVNPTTAFDLEYNEPILQITEIQNITFKKLIQ